MCAKKSKKRLNSLLNSVLLIKLSINIFFLNLLPKYSFTPFSVVKLITNKNINRTTTNKLLKIIFSK